MNRVFLSLGTNIEPKVTYLRRAIQKLEKVDEISIVQQSSVYQTDPVDYLDQDDFLNMVIELFTSYPPEDLLEITQAIEKKLGRKREIRFGPRTIDIDILIYGSQKITTEKLTIPHPRMHKRAFIIVPFYEIAEDVFIPSVDQSVQQLYNSLDERDLHCVKRLGKL